MHMDIAHIHIERLFIMAATDGIAIKMLSPFLNHELNWLNTIINQSFGFDNRQYGSSVFIF